MKHSLIALALIGIVAITAGLSCGQAGTTTLRGSPAPVTLEVWRVFDPSSHFQKIISAYQALHPNVRVNYRVFTYDEFEREVVNALAEDRGPDIISVQNSAVKKWQSKIEALPAKITVPYVTVKGAIKKETFTEMRTSATPSQRALRDAYLDVVLDDVLIGGSIYGLPLSVDTLALYYNKDLLKNAGIVSPPKTWAQFQENVVRLTRQDQRGTLVQSAATIGGANNIPRSADLLALLMMQNGAQMTAPTGAITFQQIPQGIRRAAPPAVEALEFYADFASPAKQVYTWNNQMPTAFEAFIAGKAAFYFDYSFAHAQIRARAPKLSFDVAQIPQIEGNSPVNYASYWVEAVTKKSKNKDVAWDFILFETSPQQVSTYLTAAGKPTALKTLVASQAEDLVLAPFVSQLLTAKSWYHGTDPDAVTQIFKDMINERLAGTQETHEIVNLGANKVAQTL